jgi:hypothetical protein
LDFILRCRSFNLLNFFDAAACTPTYLKLVQNAQGQLEDGRRFNLHITHLKDTEGGESVQIRFR